LAGSELTLITSSAGMNFYVGNHQGLLRLLAQLPGDQGLRARVDSLRQAVQGGRR
jgi:hypothetical protein